MAEVVLKNIDKLYENGFHAVRDLNLDIADGEFLVLVGPSGCGKSTALRMVAGLEDISGGDLFIGDRRVNDLPPQDRDIAMVFQSYALYPHMSVADNIAYGLKLRKDAEAANRRADQEGRRHAGTQRLPRPQTSATLRWAASAGGDGSGHRPRASRLPDGRAAE